jgi:signal transduction histidine kinase
VKVTLDRRPMLRELGGLVLRSLALMLLILLAGSWAGLVFSRRVTEPLGRLTDAVRAFGSGGEFRDLAGMPADEIGRLAEAFATMRRDIVEREREQQRLTERLREAQKMEAVGALSQGISHDFKNILSTLKAAVHILQKGEPDNAFVLKYTGKMQTSIDRARDLVERLVAFSRTRQFDLRPLDLAALVARLAPMLREALGEAVRLELALPASPVRVDGDEASLQQLLLNLAYNGRDAMPGGGVLGIGLEALPPSAPDAPGAAVLTVRDTGTGMEPEVLRRLFEPFFTTKGAGGGMGLGLSIVHGIVEQHHGAIDVESAPGSGTSFRVRLPLAPGSDAAGGEGGGDG